MDSPSTFLGVGKPNEHVSDKYELQQVIGKGTFGVVRRCTCRETGDVYAVKTVVKSQFPDLTVLKREIEILSQVEHPNIIRLFDVFEEDAKIHVILDLCTGGELYDQVVAKSRSPEKHFSEYDVARIMRSVLDAMAYLHDTKKVVHRDLKVENFLLLNTKDDSPVKIIDFGFSRYNLDNIMKSRVGTVYYVAPEVVTDEHYTNKCDIWSCGVIAYVLLCGFPPFYDENESTALELVKTGQLSFPSPIWDDISGNAKRFVRTLLARNPEKRPTASEALTDSWLNNPPVPPARGMKLGAFLTGRCLILTGVSILGSIALLILASAMFQSSSSSGNQEEPLEQLGHDRGWAEEV